MYEEFYIPGSAVPDVFRKADRIMDKKLRPLKVMTAPREIPMPRIEGCPGAIGPIHITEDWYNEKMKKKEEKKAKDRKKAEIEIIKYLAQQNRLRFKLGELDPSKKKNEKKIASINITLKNIEAEIRMLQEQNGISISELDRGSKIGQFVGRMKRRLKKIAKKVKKFYRDNTHLIDGLAAIILPFVGSFIIKRIFHL